MSVHAYSYVWDNSKEKGSSLLALLALADYADQDTGECYPSIATLAKMLRMSERNVQLLLRKLETNKAIVVEQNKGVNTPSGATNRYTILGYVEWRKAVKLLSPPKDEGVKNPVVRGEKSGIEGVKPASPNPLVIQPLESINTTAPKVAANIQSPKKYPKSLKRWTLQDAQRYWSENKPTLDALATAWGRDLIFCDTMSKFEMIEFIETSQELLATGLTSDKFQSLAIYTKSKMGWKGAGLRPLEMAKLITQWRESHLQSQPVITPPDSIAMNAALFSEGK